MLLFQAFEDELRRRQRDLDTLRQQGQPLQERGAGSIVEPEVSRLSRRWQDVNNQVATIQYAPLSLTSEEGQGQVTRTTYTMVQQSVTRASPPKSTTQIKVDIRRLSDQITDINRQLTGPELGGKDFDDFSKQEDILKVIFRNQAVLYLFYPVSVSQLHLLNMFVCLMHLTFIYWLFSCWCNQFALGQCIFYIDLLERKLQRGTICSRGCGISIYNVWFNMTETYHSGKWIIANMQAH